MIWIKQHTIWLLLAGLVLILLANAWLFFPRYILGERKITSEDLSVQTAALHEVSRSGAELMNHMSQGEDHKDSLQQLADLQRRSDEIVVILQHQPYEVALEGDVKENLELAQLVSFTLRDAGFSGGDKLKMGVTSQVLAKAATSAQQLQVER